MLSRTKVRLKGMIKAMKVQITAKKMQLSQSFTDYAEERLSAKLDKFFGDEASAKIVLSTVKNKIILELTVEFGGVTFRAEQSADDKNDALDACIDKIIRQIRKNKTRLSKQLRDNSGSRKYGLPQLGGDSRRYTQKAAFRIYMARRPLKAVSQTARSVGCPQSYPGLPAFRIQSP